MLPKEEGGHHGDEREPESASSGRRVKLANWAFWNSTKFARSSISTTENVWARMASLISRSEGSMGKYGHWHSLGKFVK